MIASQLIDGSRSLWAHNGESANWLLEIHDWLKFSQIEWKWALGVVRYSMICVVHHTHILSLDWNSIDNEMCLFQGNRGCGTEQGDENIIETWFILAWGLFLLYSSHSLRCDHCLYNLRFCEPTRLNTLMHTSLWIHQLTELMHYYTSAHNIQDLLDLYWRVCINRVCLYVHQRFYNFANLIKQQVRYAMPHRCICKVSMCRSINSNQSRDTLRLSRYCPCGLISESDPVPACFDMHHLVILSV